MSNVVGMWLCRSIVTLVCLWVEGMLGWMIVACWKDATATAPGTTYRVGPGPLAATGMTLCILAVALGVLVVAGMMWTSASHFSWSV